MSDAPTPAAAAVPIGGPTTGLIYADVPNRAIAYIIDAIVLFVINIIVSAILGAIGLIPATINADLTVSVNYVASLIYAAISLAISAAYFIYFWTTSRATIGMRALSLQIGKAPGGETITQDQAIRRWLALSAPFILAQVLQPLPLLGFILPIAALGWVIYLIYTTAQSPTKQGWHDVFAGTMVVKAVK